VELLSQFWSVAVAVLQLQLLPIAMLLPRTYAFIIMMHLCDFCLRLRTRSEAYFVSLDKTYGIIT
jgi:hypothetical protein